MTQKAARMYDEGKPCGPEANAAKFLGSEAGFEAADRAMQFHGGYSMSTEYHVSKNRRESMIRLQLLERLKTLQQMPPQGRPEQPRMEPSNRGGQDRQPRQRRPEDEEPRRGNRG